jgi:predicted nucleic acid-binding protein
MFADFERATNEMVLCRDEIRQGQRPARLLAGRSNNDLWIAATAHALGTRLLTRNPREFAVIDGLEVLGY